MWTISFLLNCLLIMYVSGRENLCSGNEHLLCVSRTKRAIGDCSFCVAGQRLWNSLTSHIRFSPLVNVFKKSLKTHLFPSDWFAFYLGIISLCFNFYVILCLICSLHLMMLFLKLCYILYLILPILKFYSLWCFFILYSAMINLE